MQIHGSSAESAGIVASLGFDLGAVYAKLAGIDQGGETVFALSHRHHGMPLEVLRGLLGEFRSAGGPASLPVGVTGRYADLLARDGTVQVYDVIRTDIAAVRRRFPEVRNILNIGGGSVTLIRLNERGEFVDYSTNSLCAAGTGAFLDQQAKRLGMDYDTLGSFRYEGEPPPIATRCSVFAKTDLIHRQQEGYSRDALWAGLCKSMSRTCLNAVLRGRQLDGLTVVTGGVSQNVEVMRRIGDICGDLIVTWERASLSGASGAAQLAAAEGAPVDLAALDIQVEKGERRSAGLSRRPPLRIERSRYPDFKVKRSFTDADGNEIRISNWPEADGSVTGFVGVDIGSTSTKLVVLGADETVLLDIYRMTAGDPIGAVRKLVEAIVRLEEETGVKLDVRGLGTTGSGRKLIGHILGADMIVNEITAHLQGALHVDPEVDTIFEIGGQDSKYIRAQEGRIRDSNMNYVCAAGTGSFVEEQAKKLGFTLDEIGDVVMGVAPPVTSDRCTVFMEQDVEYLVRLGFTREECIAAVLYSVVRNYLNKVVGRRTISDRKIFFQGATARNRGLVAAFENVLGREIVVSPYCHVLGSYGAALIAKRTVDDGRRPTSFPGLEIARRPVHIRSEHCTLCENHCKITFARIEGREQEHSWGYLCGREPGEHKARRREEFEPMRQRKRLYARFSAVQKDLAGPAVVLPRMLTSYSYLPFWTAFFEALGRPVRLTPPTDREIIALGGGVVAADFCLPVKIAHGHVLKALEMEGDLVLLPHMICPHRNPKTSNSMFCPYVQSVPSVIKSALSVHHHAVGRIASPVVDFRKSRAEGIASLTACLGGALGVGRAEVARAWDAARARQQAFETGCAEAGRALVAEVEREGRPAVVLFGRPYNIHDAGSNLGLPQKIAELGVRVIPLDMLPVSVEELDPAFENMYWAYGQRILASAGFVRSHDLLFGLYFTNFSCGPDSFLLTHVEQVMGEKPMLTVEIDEHGGDAGYMTRVEAFLDVIRAWGRRKLPPPKPLRRVAAPKLTGSKIYVPSMHDLGARLFAGAFRRFGLEAEALPVEDEETCELGRSLTRGSECLPAATTIGAIVSTLRARPDGTHPAQFFMPSASGPCRFGQYGLLHRSVLDRLGFADVGILAPCASNAYAGFTTKQRKTLWTAIVVADLIEKMACRIRPYETSRGETDRVVEESVCAMEDVLAGGGSIERGFEDVVRAFGRIRRGGPARPLVGLVGEIYVRCNRFCNDDVVRTVESLGGEVWRAPVSEWVLYSSYLTRILTEPGPLSVLRKLMARIKDQVLHHEEEKYFSMASNLVSERREWPIEAVIEAGRRYVPLEFQGEGILTLGRSWLFATRDNALLVINAAPFTCMPGTVTSAVLPQVQAETGIPMVSIFYEGKPGQNDRLAVYMKNLVPALHQSQSGGLGQRAPALEDAVSTRMADKGGRLRSSTT